MRAFAHEGDRGEEPSFAAHRARQKNGATRDEADVANDALVAVHEKDPQPDDPAAYAKGVVSNRVARLRCLESAGYTYTRIAAADSREREHAELVDDELSQQPERLEVGGRRLRTVTWHPAISRGLMLAKAFTPNIDTEEALAMARAAYEQVFGPRA